MDFPCLLKQVIYMAFKGQASVIICAISSSAAIKQEAFLLSLWASWIFSTASDT